MVLNIIKTCSFLLNRDLLLGGTGTADETQLRMDAGGNCHLGLHSLLIESGKHLVLVDTGVGDKFAGQMEEFGYSGIRAWSEMLAEYGHKVEDVTDVVLTSLHFMHCGGTTSLNGSGEKLELTFPNARVYVGDKQWRNMMNPPQLEENMYFPSDVMEVLKQDKVVPLKEDTKICEGVELRLADAQTAGQIIPYVKDGAQTYIFGGEMFPTSAHLSPGVVEAHCADPLAAAAWKERTLKEASEKGVRVVLPYDEAVACCTVKTTPCYGVGLKVTL